MSKGHLIVIVAPSGTGKSTLIKEILKDFPQISWSVSCTTRSPREGEINGTHYHFLSKAEFEAKRDTGDFVEWAVVHSNYYGTSKELVTKALANHQFVLFDIDVQGADAIKKAFPNDSTAIFIRPPSFEVLQQRLTGRGTESKEKVEERLANAKSELTRQNDYDELVTNDIFDRAVSELKAIFKRIVS